MPASFISQDQIEYYQSKGNQRIVDSNSLENYRGIAEPQGYKTNWEAYDHDYKTGNTLSSNDCWPVFNFARDIKEKTAKGDQTDEQ